MSEVPSTRPHWVNLILEQVELDCRVDAAQPSRVIGEYGPSPLVSDVDDVSSAGIEDASGQEQLVDLGGGGGVEFAKDDRGVAQDFGKLRRGVGTDCTDLSQGQGGEIQRQRQRPGSVEPGHRGDAPTYERGQRRGIDDFAADHAAVSGATMCRRRISSSPGQSAPNPA